MYQLFDAQQSSSAYRVRIALALKGVSHESVPLDLAAGEHHELDYRSVNPQGLVPCYHDGANYFSQSLAIIELLNEQYPDPPLLPSGLAARARARQIATLIGSDMQPFAASRVRAYLQANFDADEAAYKAWVHHWLLDGLDALELWLTADSSTSAFAVGDAVSIADIFIVPMLYKARALGIDTEDFPRLDDIYENCLALSAFRDTAP